MSNHLSDSHTKKMRLYDYFNARPNKWKDANIILIENYPCKTRLELLKREIYFVKELKPELNDLYTESNIKQPNSKWKDPAYREKQYNYYSKTIKCEICNCEYSRSHRDRHLTSTKHKNMIDAKNKMMEQVKQQVKQQIENKIKLLDLMKANLNKNT